MIEKIEGSGLGRQGRGKQEASTNEVLDDRWAASMLPRRTASAHKWDVGGVVVVAGSPPFAGAAALSCAAAGRSGAGIVSAALPRSIAHTVVGLVPEVTVVMLPEGESPSVAKRAADAIGERLERSGAMLVGPGLGVDDATDALLSALFGATRSRGGIGFGTGSATTTADEGVIVKANKPVVVDADALTWLSSQDQWWARVPAGLLVLTPHPGEMARLRGIEIAEVLSDPSAIARDAATDWGQTVLLKGGTAVVASPDGSTASFESSPALATAGSGDVLGGSVAAFLAQGLGPRDAAMLASYVGIRAAERAAGRFGTLGVIAGDLPLAVAETIAALEKLED